jgi:cytoskeletal protein RodZ
MTFMKVQRKNKKNVLIASIAVALILLSVGSVFVYVYANFKSQDEKSQIQNEDTPNDSENKQELDDKREAIEGKDNNSSSTTPPTQDSIKVTARQDGDSVIVSTELTAISSGTCNLAIKNGLKSYSSNVDIVYQSQFSTCAGFSVKKSQLGAGTWDINIDVKTPNASVSKQIGFEVN